MRYALRQLIKHRGFTAVAVITLALGIGANTAIFQLLNAVRLKTLPVSRPHELIEIRLSGGNPGLGISEGSNSEMTYPLWEQVQRQREAFAGLFAWGTGDMPLGRDVETRMVRCLWVSGDFFSVLGLTPARGRLFQSADDQRGAAPEGVVISHGYWQSEYGGRESVVGEPLTIGDRVLQIVGVAPEGFVGLDVGRQFDVALPLSTRAIWWDKVLDRTDTWWLRVMGRMKPGSDLRAAAGFIEARSASMIEATLPVGYAAGAVEIYRKFHLSVFPCGTGVSQLRAEYERALWLLLGITGLVLVIACVNLANLTLARASVRAREMAVRLALGASRWRLIRQLLLESLLLAGAGALAGAVLAHVLSRSIVWFLSTQGKFIALDVGADWRVLSFTTAAGVLTCVFFGLAPAIRSSRIAPAAAMSGGRGASGTRDRHFLQQGLTMVQMAMSLILLSGALLLVRSFWNLATLQPGFRPDGVLVTYVSFARQNLTPERRLAFKNELLEEIRSLPQVEAAALTSHVPVIGGSWTMGVRVTGAAGSSNGPSAAVEQEGSSKVAWVSPGYFRTMQIPILSGRDIAPGDTDTSPKVALVNETFVRRWLGHANPIGARMRTIAEPGYPEATYEIVGVVRDTKYGALRSEIPPIAFAPATQSPGSSAMATVVVRASGPLPEVASSVRQRIAQLDPQMRMGTVVLKASIRAGLARDQLLAWLSGFFGVVAVGLVMVGLYGLISYTTLTRRNELGLRLALGATRANILWMILRQGLRLAATGVAVGVAGALGLMHFLGSLLFGLNATDVTTLGLTSLLLVAVAAAACWWPARRAAAAEPMEALRYE